MYENMTFIQNANQLLQTSKHLSNCLIAPIMSFI